ncbi:MAG: MFS transporter [Myxococcota bacterium]
MVAFIKLIPPPPRKPDPPPPAPEAELTSAHWALPTARPGNAVPGAAAPFLSGPVDETQPSSRDVRGVLRRSLSTSSVEGMAAEVVTACCNGAAMTGWALEMECNAFLFGILGAIPYLSQFIQLPAAWVSTTLGRRRVALTAVCLQRLVLLPVLFLPFLSAPMSVKQTVLLFSVAISSVLGVTGNNSWVAWMGDLVPRRMRGRYFAQRAAWCTVAGTSAGLLAGLLMDTAKAHGVATHALLGLGVVGQLAGLCSIALMARQHEPAPGGARESVHWRMALRPLSDSRARAFLTYQVAWNGAVGLCGSFAAMHMLMNLKMGFAMMSAHATAVAAVRVLSTRVWGRVLDQVGPRTVLVFCSFGICLVPLMWLFPTEEMLWPVVLDALLVGTLWSGHGLAAFQLPLEVAPREGRAFYLASFSTAGGIAYGLASALGGVIAEALPTSFTVQGVHVFNIHVLFLLSSSARLGAAFLSVRAIQQEREVMPGLRRCLDAVIKDVGPRLAWRRT